MNHEGLSPVLFRRAKSKPLTIENINLSTDDDLDQLVMDGLEEIFSACNYNTANFIKRLPFELKAFYLTWVVEGEVNNGGFNQLYWNGYGYYANDALQAFIFFGAKEHANIMSEAITIRKKESVFISLLKIIGTTRAFSYSYKISKLNIADAKFYNINESLSSLRVAKIRENPNFFALASSESCA